MTETMKRRDAFRRGYRYKSAIDGRYVSRVWALFNPSTTYAEKITKWP